MNRSRSLLASLLVAAALVACQNDQPPSDDEGQETPEGTDLGEGEDEPDLGEVVIPQGFVILIVNPEEVSGRVLTTHQLSAHVVSSTGQRISGVPVEFEIVGDESGQSHIAPTEPPLTDSSGKAEVDLFLGEQVGTFTVQVSVRGTDETAEIPVRVEPRPTGELSVSFEGIGPATIAPIEVYVMPGDTPCPYNPVVTPHGELVKDRVSSISDTTTFDHARFTAGESVTLWARGMVGTAQMRTRAATGCQDGVMIPDGGVNSVTLSLVVLPLNCVGTFDAVGHYDFTDAIPGTAGEVIDRLELLFNNTAAFLIDSIQDLLELFVGGIYAAAINWAVDEIIQPLVEPAINEWIMDAAPDWLLDFFTIGNDLLQIVNNLEALSVIRFDKTGSDFTVAGTEEWVGLALYWRLDCDEDDPPDCGRHEFNMEDLANAQDPIEAVFATFQARTTNFNRLEILTHDVNLQYGRLILFVLNELILPAVADGAHSLTEAIINALDCEGLAWRICGDDGEWGGTYLGVHIGFDVIDAIGWCEGAAGFLGDMAESILGDLSFDSVLTLRGSCDLYEDDFDLMVDRLVDCRYRGHINIDGVQGDENLNAEFHAVRREGSR